MIYRQQYATIMRSQVNLSQRICIFGSRPRSSYTYHTAAEATEHNISAHYSAQSTLRKNHCPQDRARPRYYNNALYRDDTDYISSLHLLLRVRLFTVNTSSLVYVLWIVFIQQAPTIEYGSRNRHVLPSSPYDRDRKHGAKNDGKHIVCKVVV